MTSSHSELLTRASLSSNANTTRTTLDLDQWRPSHRKRELLELIWSDDFDFLYDLGANTYVYIFDHAPQTRGLFPAFTVHGDGWRESKEFRAQALRFVQTLSQTIVHLHDMDSLKSLLNNLGRKHVRFAARGFRPEHWDVFRSAMNSALAGHMAALPTLTDQDRAEAVEAWHVLSDYIVYQMQKGFSDGLVMDVDKTGSSSCVK
jgi:hemoglobin-like flavoprotein